MKNNEPEITEQDDSEVAETSNGESTLKLLHSETLRIGLLVFVSLLLLVFAAPYFLDNSALKFQLTQKLSQSLQTKLEIHGKVRVTLLPHPAIIAKDVVLQNYKLSSAEKSYDLYAESVEVQFPIFNSGAGVKKIIFTDAMAVGYYGTDKSMMSQDELTKKITEFSKNATAENSEDLGSGITAKLFSVADLSSSLSKKSQWPQIVIKNGQFNSYDKLGRKKETRSIDASAEIAEQKISAEGDFVSQNIASNFKLVTVFNSKSGKPDSSFDLVSPVLEMHVKGNFISRNIGLLKSDFSGQFEAEIMELKSFYQSYVESEGVVATKLKYNAKPIKISAHIDSETQEITVSDVKISSDLVNGNGRFYFNLANQIPIADIALSLENIDLDSIWSNEVVKVVASASDAKIEKISDNEEVAPTVEKTEESEQKTEALKLDLNLTKKVKDLDLTAEINVKKIKYLAGEIDNADLYLSTSGQGDIMLMPAIFQIPGEGVVRVSGVFDNSTLVSKFIGKLDARGKSLKEILRWLKIELQNLKLDALGEYVTYSDILLLPNNVALSNFYLSLNEDKSEISGDVRFDNDGKAINSSGRFHVNSLNIDDHFLISGQNTYFSPGLLLKKLFWLNDVASSNAFEFSFDKLIYKKEEFAEQSFKFMIRRGYIEISDLNLQSPQTDLKANLFFDISGQNPHLKIDIEAKKFHYETPHLDADKEAEKKINSFDQFFALPSLEGFAGDINLNFADAQIDGIKIANAKLVGQLKDGNVDKADFAAEFYGGKFSYQGVLGLKINKTINGNLSFENADLQALLSDLLGVKNISGVGNFAANITSVAGNKNEFSKQLKSELKFSVNVPAVEGYGLSDLTKKMFAPRTYAEELKTPEKILFNPKSKTIFNQASGVIQISNGNDGKLRINVAGPAMNGILSGAFSAEEKSIDLLFNAIFLTGSESRQTPINVATNLRGKTDNILQNTNIDQARQYLGLPVAEKTVEKSVLVQ